VKVALGLAAACLLLVPASALSQASLSVTPGSVPAGGSVTVSGSVGNGCQHGDEVTVISEAFDGAQGEFAGVPAVTTNSDSAGNFSVTASIPSTRSPGSYPVSARCGGGRFGDAQVTIVASGTSTLPRTGFTPWLFAAFGLAMVLAGAALRRSLAGDGPPGTRTQNLTG
jgi:LPXTG-motif cell wall-anchored protein